MSEGVSCACASCPFRIGDWRARKCSYPACAPSEERTPAQKAQAIEAAKKFHHPTWRKYKKGGSHWKSPR